jgi:hypothetical protein
VISKVFKKIYDAPGNKLPSSEVKVFLSEHHNAVNSFVHTLYTIGHVSRWYNVFELIEDNICIKQEAIEFTRTLV